MNNTYKYKNEQPIVHTLLDNLGGNDFVAAKLGISSAAVSWWRKNGIPKLRMYELMEAFGDEVIEKAKQEKKAA